MDDVIKEIKKERFKDGKLRATYLVRGKGEEISSFDRMWDVLQKGGEKGKEKGENEEKWGENERENERG